MTSQNPVADLKREMAELAMTGRAARYRGFIVSAELWDQLARDQRDEEFKGRMGVSGTKGNLAIRYSFYVLKHPNYPEKKTDGPFFPTHYTEEVYKAKYLGHELEFLDGFRGRTMPLSRGGRGNTLEETAPMLGMVTIREFCGARYLYQVDYDEAVERIRGAQDPERLLLELYDPPVNNPPEAHWRGDMQKLLDMGEADPTIDPFMTGLSQPRISQTRNTGGRLLMSADERNLCMIGVTAKNGVVIYPNSVFPWTNPRGFAQEAIKRFLPEEVYIFLMRQALANLSATNLRERVAAVPSLEELKAIPVEECWESYVDPDAGLVKEYTSTGGREEGHLLSTSVVSTRARTWHLDVEFMPFTQGEEAWEAVRKHYFLAE